MSFADEEDEESKKLPGVANRQRGLIEAYRRENYVLAAALEAQNLTERIFRNWYIHDTEFKKAWDALEDEDVGFMHQTLRELAKGTHVTSEGKPNVALLRYVITEHDKRRKGIDLEDGDLIGDLEDLSDEQLRAMARGMGSEQGKSSEPA